MYICPSILGAECFVFPSISIHCWVLAALFTSLWSIRTNGTARRARQNRPSGSRLCRYKTHRDIKWRTDATSLLFNLWRDLGIGKLCCDQSLKCTCTSLIWDDLGQYLQWFVQLVTWNFVVWSYCIVKICIYLCIYFAFLF